MKVASTLIGRDGTQAVLVELSMESFHVGLSTPFPRLMSEAISARLFPCCLSLSSIDDADRGDCPPIGVETRPWASHDDRTHARVPHRDRADRFEDIWVQIFRLEHPERPIIATLAAAVNGQPCDSIRRIETSFPSPTDGLVLSVRPSSGGRMPSRIMPALPRLHRLGSPMRFLAQS